MNIKKLLSSALVVVMLFTTMVALIPPVKTEAAYSSSVDSSSDISSDKLTAIVNEMYEYKFETNLDMLNYELEAGYLDYVSSKGNEYTMYVNRYTGVLYYKNNITGQVLSSNPCNPNCGASIETRYDLMSQIAVTYLLKTGISNVPSTMLSATTAAAFGQIKVSPIYGGLRVSYALGDTSTRYVVPVQITSAKYTELLLNPMLESFKLALEKYIGEDKPDTNFDFYAAEAWGRYAPLDNYDLVQQGAIQEYLTQMKNSFNYLRTKNRAAYNELNSMQSAIMSFTRAYNLKNPAKFDYSDSVGKEALDKMYKEAPLTEDGIAVYVLNLDPSAKAVGKIQNSLFKYTTYSMQQLEADEAECEYVYQIKEKPVFRCSLEYTFNDDGSLSVRLPANSIVFDESVYTLDSITPLSHFGAGDLRTDGYVFVPDGSGSIINYDEFYSADNQMNRQNLSVVLGIYGDDFCYSSPEGYHREQVTMPVFGVVTEEKANKLNKELVEKDKLTSGYFAILEEGSSLAKVNARFGGTKHIFASVFASYEPFPSDEYNLQDTISVSGVGSSYTIVSESKYTGSYVTRYVMLQDTELGAASEKSFYQSSYIGMATYYRDYLKKQGVLTALEDVGNDLPLYIEALGSMEVVQKILTFPVTVSVPLTTFDDIATMYKELSDAKNILLKKSDEYKALAEAEEDNLDLKASYEKKAADYIELSEEVVNITNISFKLTGFANGGMYFTYPSTVIWESACGGDDGFNRLVDTAKEVAKDGKNLGIFPEFDFLYMSNTAMFDGVSENTDVSRMVDNRYASKQVYNSVLREYESIFSMVISPDALDKLYSKFVAKYSTYGATGLSVSTLGSNLNSNFDAENPINREESREYVESLLNRISKDSGYSTMIDVGNIYAVKYADNIIDINLDSSHLTYSSYAIPFTGLVLHGYVNYAGGALNYSGSPDYDMLRAIENGAALYYILCYQNTNHLKEDVSLNKYYGVSYENWFDLLVEQYDKLNDAIGELQDYEIVDHKVILAERVIDKDEVKANNELLKNEFLNLVKTQLQTKIDETLNKMAEDAANNGRGIKIEVNTDSLILQASECLNLSKEELIAYDFDEKLADLIAEFKLAYPLSDTQENPELISFESVEYSSQYEYVTDSFAEDKDYDYTDYTVDNNLVVMVTYRNAEGKTVRFILNYNIYSVKINLGEGEPIILDKYAFWKG